MNANETQEVKNISVIPVVRNDIDDPSALSVSSVGPIPESVDSTPKTEQEKKEEEAVSSQPGQKTEVKEEEKEETETETKAEEETPQKTEEKPTHEAEAKPKDAVQKRIDELTKKRRAAERDAEFERNKRLELEKELEDLKKKVPAEGKPDPADFETEAEYLEALADWKIEQKINQKDQKSQKAESEKDEKKQVDEAYKELDAKMEKGRKKYSDFDDLVLKDEELKISEAMTEVMLLSDITEDIAYYLAKHPEESAKIAELPPTKMAYELGKIEARLLAPPPKKKISQAPEPITPVKPTGMVDKDPSTMTPKEYRAWRESGGK